MDGEAAALREAELQRAQLQLEDDAREQAAEAMKEREAKAAAIRAKEAQQAQEAAQDAADRAVRDAEAARLRVEEEEAQAVEAVRVQMEREANALVEAEGRRLEQAKGQLLEDERRATERREADAAERQQAAELQAASKREASERDAHAAAMKREMREAALAEEAARLAEAEEVKRREALLEAKAAQMRLEREEAARARARDQATDKRGGVRAPDIYKDVEEVDTAELLDIVSKIPLKVYELEKDTMEGRRRFGVIGEEIESLVPQAVRVGRRAFAQGPNKPPVFVDDVAIVDDPVLFMHGVGAVQQLWKKQEHLRDTTRFLSVRANETASRFKELDDRLHLEPRELDEERLSEARKDHVSLENEELLDKEALAEKKAALQRQKLENATLRVEDAAFRDRARAEDLAARDRHAEKLRLQEQSVRDQEEVRRKTDEALLKQRLEDEVKIEALRKEAELARVKAEEEVRAAMNRANEDIHLRAMRAKAAEDRKRVLEAVQLVSSYVARGASTLLDDPKLLTTLVGAIVALVGGGHFAREAAILTRSLAEAYLGRPRLVRETSRRYFGKTTTAAKGLVGVLVSPLVFVLRTPRHLVIIRRRLMDLRLFFVFFFMALFYSVAHILSEGVESAKHHLHTVKLLVERRKLDKTTRTRLAKGDREFHGDLKKRRQEAYAAACNGRREAAHAARSLVDGQRLRVVQEAHRLADELRQKERAKEAAFLEGVVLPDALTDRVLQLAIATRNAKANRAPFRHMLLHGPPGTGKTLVAKKLAIASGLEYALMSGGDVGPLGSDGVTALHTLFRWARTSETGVLVFIDEAEAFLASRSRARLTEHMRNALNAFLYQTGSPTTSFVLVLATNRAEDLDEAVLDRVDETLYFGLPAYEARAKLVNLYYDIYCARLMERKLKWQRLKAFWDALTRAPARLRVSADVTPSLLKNVALDTDDFSGREIEKLFVAVQSAAYGRGGRLDANTITTAVATKRAEHDRKNAMNAADASLRSSAVDTAVCRSPNLSPRGAPDGKRSPRRR